MKKVIYTGTQKYWKNIAIELEHKYAWLPVYWIGLGEQTERTINNIWSGIVFHEFMNAMKAIPAKKYAGCGSVLDENILHQYSVEESIALKMMDRLDYGGAFDYAERVRHYHRLLSYWLYVIDDLQPDIVIFSESPHMVFDYVLYGICKKKKIMTFMFEHFPANGWLFPIHTFEDGVPQIRKCYIHILKEVANGRAMCLSEKTEAYFNKLSGSHRDAAPYYVQELMYGKQKYLNLLKEKLFHPQKYFRYVFLLYKTLSVSLLASFKWMFDFLFANAPLNYLKQKNKTLETSNMSGLQWRIHKLMASVKKYTLKNYYIRNLKTVDLSNPYVFVPLQYQPEKTSSPDGGVFADQFLFIDMLRKVIPEDWHIYIKENPGQFWRWHGERSRKKWWYSDLLAMSNVSFIPLEASTFDLIDNAKVVATIRGTAGWESVVRGVPVIIFGTTWYRDCEGVFYTPTKDMLKDAIKTIQSNNYSIDTEKVRLFLVALEKSAYHGCLIPKFAHYLGISDADNSKSIVKAIVDLCEKGLDK